MVFNQYDPAIFGRCPQCDRGDNNTRLFRRRLEPDYLRCDNCRRREYVAPCTECVRGGDRRPKRTYRRGSLCEHHGGRKRKSRKRQ